jgi:hypothetical protein
VEERARPVVEEHGRPAADGPARRAAEDAAEDQARPAAEGAGTAGVVPLLAILVVAVAGVYVAWGQGSHGGGEGGIIAGVALLAGAVVRLFLPARLAGLLAVRKRLTDVATLTVFGAGLLITGLVLPR